LIVCVVWGALAPRVRAQNITKEAVPLNEAKRCVDDFQSNGYKPIFAKANPQPGGKILYDFVFAPEDNTTQWSLDFAISDADWQQKKSDFFSLGWTLSSSNSFLLAGKKVHCSLWTKAN
jgi:hypothetical protein